MGLKGTRAPVRLCESRRVLVRDWLRDCTRTRLDLDGFNPNMFHSCFPQPDLDTRRADILKCRDW
jgi:hypothetical protein